MFTWIDGHLILAMLLSPVISMLTISLLNARTARRMQTRRTSGGAR